MKAGSHFERTDVLKPPAADRPAKGGAAPDKAALDAMIPPLPDSYWKPSPHSSIREQREAADKARTIYATLSADQRATLLKTGKFALEVASATPQQAEVMRSWLDTVGFNQFVGDPHPDINNATIPLHKGTYHGNDYLYVGFRNRIGQKYGGTLAAPWPSEK